MKTTTYLHAYLTALTSALIAWGGAHAHANPGQLDSIFDLTDGGRWAGLVGDGSISVSQVAVQPDDKIVVAGSFDSVNARSWKNVVRLESDGRLDTTFHSPFVSWGSVNVLAKHPDGKLLIAGYLPEGPGAYVTKLFLLNSDGSIDTSFRPQISDKQSVLTVAIDDQKRILVSLSWYWDNPLMVRLLADGTLDSSFQVAAAPGYPSIYSIWPLTNGKIMIAGVFDGPPKALIRLNSNGSLDPTFDAQFGYGAYRPSLKTMVVQQDGKMIVGGTFDQVAGKSCTNLARLNEDGTLDSGFIGKGFVFNKIDAIAIQPDQKIVLGGAFTSLDGSGEMHPIVRLMPNGSVDKSFDDKSFRTVCDKNEVVQLGLDSTNRILVSAMYGGDYSVPSVLVYRLLTNGAVDTTFTTSRGAGTPVLSSAKIQPDGSICIAGAFSGVRDQARNGFARLTRTGVLLPGWDIPASYRGEGGTSVTLPDGSIIVGGTWQEHGDSGCTIFKFLPNGTLDTSWFYDAWSSNSMAVINDMTVTPEGKVIVVGLNQQQWSAIQQLMPNGRPDPFFHIPRIFGADGTGIEKVLRQTDGKLLISGEISSFDDSPAHGFVRLTANGGLDSTLDELLGGIRDMKLQPDGRVLLAGSFASSNPQKIEIVRRLNLDGSIDGALSSPDITSGQANGVCAQSNGKILVGGGFNVSSGTNTVLRRFLRLLPDGAIDPDFVQGTANDIIPDVDASPDGSIVIGGTFSVYNGVVVPGLACLIGDPVLLPTAVRALPKVSSPGDLVRVSIQLGLPENATNFVLEETPPIGWTVTNISDNGVYDQSSGAIRFVGLTNLVSYDVLVPSNRTGTATFSGRIFVEGNDKNITGIGSILVVGRHPADRVPPIFVMSEAEVNTYAASWKYGSEWPGGPMPIEQSYVSRAGYLWRCGTNYTVFTGNLPPPLCWVPVSDAPIPWEQFGPQMLTNASALRTVEHGFIEGAPLKVRLEIQPGQGTLAYTVEETLPDSWIPVAGSGEFTYDRTGGMLKWGPFFDDQSRVLEYQVIPSASTRMRQPMHGVVSCDGVNFPISGANLLKRTCHLIRAQVFSDGAMSIETEGLGPVNPILEASDDLIHWTELPYQETDFGVISVYDPYKNGSTNRFYRVRID